MIYLIQILFPTPVQSEDCWDILRHIVTNLYIGHDTEVGNSLVDVIYESKILQKYNWDIIQDNDFTFILVDGGEVFPNYLEFLEINMSLRDEDYES